MVQATIDNTMQTATKKTKPMSILGGEIKITTTIEQEHAALRGCISEFISFHTTGSAALILATHHSFGSFLFFKLIAVL